MLKIAVQPESRVESSWRHCRPDAAWIDLIAYLEIELVSSEIALGFLDVAALVGIVCDGGNLANEQFVSPQSLSNRDRSSRDKVSDGE